MIVGPGFHRWNAEQKKRRKAICDKCGEAPDVEMANKPGVFFCNACWSELLANGKRPKHRGPH